MAGLFSCSKSRLKTSANVYRLRWSLGDAEVQLRHAVTFVMNEMLERQGSALLDSITNAVIGQFDMEARVNQQLRAMISRREAFP